jgi:zinc/manganese transport system permease protein
MLDLIIVPFVATFIILLLHAYLGLHVIRRGIIFVDLAFAQVAALGTTVAMIFGFETGTLESYVAAFAFTLLGALIFSFTRMEKSLVPQEAIIGIVYVVACAAVILLSVYTPERAEHIKETLTGSILWVTWPSVATIAIPYAILGLFYYFLRRPMLAITLTPETAVKVRLWDFIFYVTFGIAITFSVAIAGVLMVFTCLVIPAVIAFLYTADFTRALWLAWFSGTVALVAGLLISFLVDLATGPTLVCTFGLVLILAALVRPLIGVRGALEEEVAAPAAEEE